MFGDGGFPDHRRGPTPCSRVHSHLHFSRATLFEADRFLKMADLKALDLRIGLEPVQGLVANIFARSPPRRVPT